METKLKISKKALSFALMFGLICSVFWSFADFNASCEELRQNVLRLHIKANSDSKEDQELKYKIRDAVLEESQNLFENQTNLEEAIKKANSSISQYEEIANRVIRENGFSYKAEAKIGEAFFNTRIYDDFTLPSGIYESLIIDIGKSEGKNWWCVIFPSVCVPTENAETLRESVGEESVQIAENPTPYKIRFKTVELYEKLKNWLN